MANKGPKREVTKQKVERMRMFLEKHPTITMAEAAKILGFKAVTVRKWKENGWIEHIGGREIAEHLGIKSASRDYKLVQKVRKEIEQKGKKQPEKQKSSVLESIEPEKFTKVSKHSAPKEKPVSGALDAEKIQELLELGKNLSISEIRSLIKQRLVTHIDDAKSVSNYAASLKSMAGVQEVELEDVYINENLIQIYMPEEKPMPKLEEIMEVDKFEL